MASKPPRRQPPKAQERTCRLLGSLVRTHRARAYLLPWRLARVRLRRHRGTWLRRSRVPRVAEGAESGRSPGWRDEHLLDHNLWHPRNSRRARWSWGQPEPPRGVGGAPRRARARWRAKTGLGMCLARRAPSRSSARAARGAPPTAPLSSLGRRLGRESGPEEHHGRSTGASKRTMALWGLSREISRSAERRPASTTLCSTLQQSLSLTDVAS